MCMSSVGNVIYHKFSHGAAFCMLNGKNVNVMLELLVTSIFISMTSDDVTFSRIQNVRDTCKRLYYIKVNGGMSGKF